MRRKFALSFLGGFLFFALSAQSFQPSPLTNHLVKAGETLYSIAKKYGLSVRSIQRANPKIERRNLRVGSTIKIPKRIGEETINKNPIHEVRPKETLYGLAKKYGVSVESIKKANGGLSEGLKIGSKIVIPLNVGNANAQEKPLNKGIKTHIVTQLGETFNSIAKTYDVTVESVKALNPKKSEPFSIGDRLRIDEFYKYYPPVREKLTSKRFKVHVVKSKETIFSIIRNEKVGLPELLRYNPELAFGLKTGIDILIPEPGIIIKALGKQWIYFEDKEEIEKGIGPNNTINIVLMAPFYLKENTEKTILPKSKFATEFYLGVTYALRTLRDKGMDIYMNVLDTEKDSSKVISLLKQNDFSNVDLIIGPFYKGLLELVADRVKDIPIISPFSKTIDLTNRENLIQYVPSDECVHKKVLNLIKNEKQENELVIVKDSGQNIKFVLKYMYSHFKKPKIYEGHIPNSSALSYDGQNVQFLFTYKDKKGIEKTLINLRKAKNYRGFRVYNLFNNASDRKFLSDYSYINTLRLVIPKTTYYTKYNPSYKAFRKSFLKDMYVTPRAYEVQGYDIAYDIVTRYSHNKNIFESLESKNSQQIQLMVNFLKQENGGYMNDSSQLFRFTNGFKLIEPENSK